MNFRGMIKGLYVVTTCISFFVDGYFLIFASVIVIFFSSADIPSACQEHGVPAAGHAGGDPLHEEPAARRLWPRAERQARQRPPRRAGVRVAALCPQAADQPDYSQNWAVADAAAEVAGWAPKAEHTHGGRGRVHQLRENHPDQDAHRVADTGAQRSGRWLLGYGSVTCSINLLIGVHCIRMKTL